MRVVDAFRDDEAGRSQEASPTTESSCRGFMPTFGGVGEHVGGINGGAEGGRVVEVVNETTQSVFSLTRLAKA